MCEVNCFSATVYEIPRIALSLSCFVRFNRLIYTNCICHSRARENNHDLTTLPETSKMIHDKKLSHRKLGMSKAIRFMAHTFPFHLPTANLQRANRCFHVYLQLLLLLMMMMLLSCAAFIGNRSAQAQTKNAPPTTTTTSSSSTPINATSVNANNPKSDDANGNTDGRVGLTDAATDTDESGVVSVTASLRGVVPASGTTQNPIRNVRFALKNNGARFVPYAAGRISFYGADGVRCGDGLFSVNAFAAGETIEADAPDLRLTCAPAQWRIRLMQVVLNTSTAYSATPQRTRPQELPAPTDSSTAALPTATNTDATVAATNTAIESNALIVFIDRHKKFFVGGAPVAQSELGARINAALTSNPTTASGTRLVSISADAEVEYALIVEAINAAKAAGATRLQLTYNGQTVNIT